LNTVEIYFRKEGKMKSILALFPNTAAVNTAIDNLRTLGFTDEVMSVVTTKDAISNEELNIDNDSVAGIKEGAKMGGAIGGLLGLLAGIGAITIPGFGVLLISGPLATALGLSSVAGATAGGAITGALAGGLLATFKELGIDETQAKLYEEKVKSGFILLGVAVESDRVSEIESVLRQSGAEDVKSFDLRPLALDEDTEDEKLEHAIDEGRDELVENTNQNMFTDSSSSHHKNFSDKVN
jgi:hypothetical protein